MDKHYNIDYVGYNGIKASEYIYNDIENDLSIKHVLQ